MRLRGPYSHKHSVKVDANTEGRVESVKFAPPRGPYSHKHSVKFDANAEGRVESVKFPMPRSPYSQKHGDKFDADMHFHHTRIFDPFQGTPGVKTAKNGGKPAHPLKNDNKSLKICLDMVFRTRNLLMVSIFTIIKYLPHFGAQQGSKCGNKMG